MYLIIREIYHARCIFFLDLNKSRISGNMKMKKGSTKFLSHLKILQRGFSSQSTKNRTRRKDRERILFPSAVASTRSGNEWFVGGERKRESLYYHIHEASISKSMSWSDGASGQRGRSHNQSLEECQCQGLARPEATTKPVRSHVSDHHSVLKQY